MPLPIIDGNSGLSYLFTNSGNGSSGNPYLSPLYAHMLNTGIYVRQTGTVPTTPVTGLVSVAPQTTNGLSGFSLISNGTVISGVVKATPGKVFGLSAGNINDNPVYFHLYDQATAPSTGNTPYQRFMIPGDSGHGAGREKTWGTHGLQFNNGISYRLVSGSGDTNTGIVAANLVTINLDVL